MKVSGSKALVRFSSFFSRAHEPTHPTNLVRVTLVRRVQLNSLSFAESLVAGPSEVDAELPTDGEAKPEAEEQAAEP